MSSKPFHFKQFSIAQERAAMKIGTDGVLLGAWTSVENYPNTILDIGTGTGIIALMLAQRSDAPTIDALELDDDAFEQAAENFENSSWGDRLFCYHAHLYEFAAEIDEEYDLIVCNPPFFEKPSLPAASSSEGAEASKSRKLARFEDAMPFELLVGAVAKLLSAEGRFTVIIPFDREEDFKLLCSRAALFPTRITHVQGTPSSAVKRSLLEFRFLEMVTDSQGNGGDRQEAHFSESDTSTIPTQLIIEKSRHDYTDAYVALVKDFYLKM